MVYYMSNLNLPIQWLAVFDAYKERDVSSHRGATVTQGAGGHRDPPLQRARGKQPYAEPNTTGGRPMTAPTGMMVIIYRSLVGKINDFPYKGAEVIKTAASFKSIFNYRLKI